MANESSNFEIGITIPLKKNEAPKAAEALDQAAKSAGNAGAGVDQAGKAIEDAGKDFEKGKEGVEKSSEAFEVNRKQAHDLREMLHFLGPEFSALGEATRFLENPIVLAVGVALIAFAKLRESIAETDKELDELAAEAAKPIGNMLEAIATAAEHAAEAQRKFAEASHAASESQSRVEKDLRNRVALYNEEIDLIAKLTKARETAAEEQIRIDQASGKLTPEQAQAALKTLGAQGERSADQFDRAKAVNEIEQTQAALAQAQKEKAGISIAPLIDQRAAAEAEAQNKGASKEGLASETKTRQTALDEATQKHEKAAATLSTNEGMNIVERDILGITQAYIEAQRRDVEELQQEVIEKKTARDQAKNAEQSNTEAEVRLKTQTDDLTRQIEERTKREQELSNLITEYKEALEKAKKSLALHDKYTPQIEDANAGKPPAPVPRTKPAGRVDAGIVDSFDAHVTTTVAQAETAIDHAEREQGAHGTISVLLDKVAHLTTLQNRSHDLHGGHLEAMGEIAREISRLNMEIDRLTRQQENIKNNLKNNR